MRHMNTEDDFSQDERPSSTGPVPTPRQVAAGLPTVKGRKFPGQVRAKVLQCGYGDIGAMRVPPMDSGECRKAMSEARLALVAGDNQNNFRRAVMFLTGLSMGLVQAVKRRVSEKDGVKWAKELIDSTQPKVKP